MCDQDIPSPSDPTQLDLSPNASIPLINQIVDGLRDRIASQALRPGMKLPSIRAFAAAHSVSVFTVIEAYDRLVAQGLLVSRANTGFFVSVPSPPDAPAAPTTPPVFNHDWYLHQIFLNRHLTLKPGCGWLPQDWLFEHGIRRSLRQTASSNCPLSGYGDPMGLLELRALTSHNLAQDQHLRTSPEQIMLVHGASQALDLAVRTLVHHGDTVLVDEPGYPNLMSGLRRQGARLLGVPRTPDGYDLTRLEQLLATQHPRVFFTQARLQSPTGSRAELPQLHRLLQLADQYDLLIVENDIYADMDPEHYPSLASMDQLRRVLYIGSYSKTVSPNLRVGYLLASTARIAPLLRLKMESGLTSSEITERLIYHALTDGRWRKHLKALRQRLAQAHTIARQQLLTHGFELFCQPDAGMYLWARHPAVPDSARLVKQAMQAGIMLGPGQLFMTEPGPTGWLRFNVAFSHAPALWDYLQTHIRKASR